MCPYKALWQHGLNKAAQGATESQGMWLPMTACVLWPRTQSPELFTCRQKVADDFCPIEKLPPQVIPVCPCRALSNFVSNFAVFSSILCSTKYMCVLLCVYLHPSVCHNRFCILPWSGFVILLVNELNTVGEEENLPLPLTASSGWSKN